MCDRVVHLPLCTNCPVEPCKLGETFMSLSVLVIYLNSVSLIECLVHGGGPALCGLIGMHSEPHGNREVQWGARKSPWCLAGPWERRVLLTSVEIRISLLPTRLHPPTHQPTRGRGCHRCCLRRFFPAQTALLAEVSCPQSGSRLPHSLGVAGSSLNGPGRLRLG